MRLIKIKDLPEGIYGPVPNKIKPLLRVDNDPKYGVMERNAVILLSINIFMERYRVEGSNLYTNICNHILNELNELYPINISYIMSRMNHKGDTNANSIKNMAKCNYLSDEEFKYFVDNEYYIFVAIKSMTHLFLNLISEDV